MVIKEHKNLSIRRQSELLSLSRSNLYVEKIVKKDEGKICNLISEIYSNYPIYGYRRITAMLRRQGVLVNHKRIARLMQEMNIRAIYPGPNTSKKTINAAIWPYLLSDIVINRPNQVWQVDITYLRVKKGFMYLTAIIDVFSRMVMGWKLSNDLQAESCLLALESAVAKHGSPEIINSDQGSQFTSDLWLNSLQNRGIKVSMTGKGRCNDNANIERLWRSFKYEGSYLYKWNAVEDLKTYIPRWIYWYNHARPHQALGYMTPNEQYREFMDKSNDLPTTSQYQLQNHDLNFVVV